MAAVGVQHNKTSFWLEENEKFFLPPVCNKMMHNDQLKVNMRRVLNLWSPRLGPSIKSL